MKLRPKTAAHGFYGALATVVGAPLLYYIGLIGVTEALLLVGYWVLFFLIRAWREREQP